MRAAVVTDEFSTDLNTALELMQEHPCKEVELRHVGLHVVPDVEDEWVRIAEKAVQARRCKVISLAPPWFQTAPEALSAQRIFALAQRLQCPAITVCAPTRPGESPHPVDPDEVVLPSAELLQPLRDFVAAAANEKLQVNLRTDAGTVAGTAAEALALLRQINAPNLGLDWDVGACFAAGDSSGLDTLEDALPVLKCVRVRDGVRRGRSADWVSVGKGVIPWEDILELLHEARYRGPVLLEPGLTPKVRETRSGLALLTRWISTARTRRPEDADER